MPFAKRPGDLRQAVWGEVFLQVVEDDKIIPRAVHFPEFHPDAPFLFNGWIPFGKGWVDWCQSIFVRFERIMIEVKLVRAGIGEAEKLWNMQIIAFQDLYDRYQDTKTSPATESVDNITVRFHQPFTYYYFITAEDITVGVIRVADHHENGVPKKISPIFILPEYRNRGLAQRAIQLAEEKHGCSGWELSTILQEKGNCHLYEKMGYYRTGQMEKINEKMTLVFYKKD